MWNKENYKDKYQSEVQQSNGEPNYIYDGWNTGTVDAGVLQEFFHPEIAANNAATRERNKWLEETDPSLQMARLKAAGVNPNTAAAGLAGAAASSSPVAQSQPQNPLAPAAELASGVGSLLSGVGSGAEGVANAANTVNLLGLNKWNLAITAARNLIGLGIDKNTADSVSLDLLYKPEQLRLGLQQLRANIYNLAQSSRALSAQYKLDLANADLAYTQMDLVESQIGVNDWRKLEIASGIAKAQAEIKYQQGLNSLLMNHNWYVQGGLPALLAGKYVQHIDDWSDEQIIEQIDELETCVHNYNYSTSEGAAAGQLDTKVNEMKANTDFQKELMRYGVLGDTQGKVIDVIIKYLFGTGFSVGVGPFSVSNSKQ